MVAIAHGRDKPNFPLLQYTNQVRKGYMVLRDLTFYAAADFKSTFGMTGEECGLVQEKLDTGSGPTSGFMVREREGAGVRIRQFTCFENALSDAIFDGATAPQVREKQAEEIAKFAEAESNKSLPKACRFGGKAEDAVHVGSLAERAKSIADQKREEEQEKANTTLEAETAAAAAVAEGGAKKKEEEQKKTPEEDDDDDDDDDEIEEVGLLHKQTQQSLPVACFLL